MNRSWPGAKRLFSIGPQHPLGGIVYQALERDHESGGPTTCMWYFSMSLRFVSASRRELHDHLIVPLGRMREFS
jgi:hypothetical protein